MPSCLCAWVSLPKREKLRISYSRDNNWLPSRSNFNWVAALDFGISPTAWRSKGIDSGKSDSEYRDRRFSNLVCRSSTMLSQTFPSAGNGRGIGLAPFLRKIYPFVKRPSSKRRSLIFLIWKAVQGGGPGWIRRWLQTPFQRSHQHSCRSNQQGCPCPLRVALGA